MEYLTNALVQILSNGVLFWGLFACGIAQLSKLIIELILFQRWRPEVLIETGGMPSSHSALVTGTAAGVGFQLGFDCPEFALAVAIAFIVMYDASGIRKAAGLTAEQVNLLSNKIFGNSDVNQALKESLGHTRLEVFVGSFIGPLIALPGLFFFGSPLHILEQLGFVLG